MLSCRFVNNVANTDKRIAVATIRSSHSWTRIVIASYDDTLIALNKNNYGRKDPPTLSLLRDLFITSTILNYTGIISNNFPQGRLTTYTSYEWLHHTLRSNLSSVLLNCSEQFSRFLVNLMGSGRLLITSALSYLLALATQYNLIWYSVRESNSSFHLESAVS